MNKLPLSSAAAAGKCTHPVDGGGRGHCEYPAVKFYVVRHDDGNVALHARCDRHWQGTALPTSRYSTEVTRDEYDVLVVTMS